MVVILGLVLDGAGFVGGDGGVDVVVVVVVVGGGGRLGGPFCRRRRRRRYSLHDSFFDDARVSLASVGAINPFPHPYFIAWITNN